MNKLYVILIAGILIIAGIVSVVFMSDNTEGQDITGELTFHIEEVGTNDELTATIGFGDITLGEQMMLAFGGNVRQTTFLPVDYSGGEEIPELKSTANYNVWITARIHVTANEDIVEISSSKISFFGFTTFPSHGVILTSSNYVSGGTDVSIFENCLVANEDVVKDMAVDGGDKFTHKMLEGSAPSTSTIQGANIDGMELYCLVDVSALDSAGATITAQALGVFTLTVGDWIEPELSITIKAMGPGSDSFSIVPPFGIMCLQGEEQ